MIKLFSRLVLALSAATCICCILSQASASEVCCAPMDAVYVSEPVVVAETSSAPSWVFRRSTFTNDPATGARVAQYMRKPPVEPLADQRDVTSSYRRTRTNIQGRSGSYDTSYQVQAWGNGRGGLDAEWQMFNDVWQDSVLAGSYYNSNQYYGPPRGGPWQNGPWQNGPQQDGPWQGGNWQGGPGYGPGGPGWNQSYPQGPPNNWNQGNAPYNGGNGSQMHWPHDGNGGQPQQHD
jgi:hypothetical protein